MNQPAYLLPVWETVTESWQKIKGAKGTFWAAFAIHMLIIIPFTILVMTLEKSAPTTSGIIDIFSRIIDFLISFGIVYIGIRRAEDLPINFRMMFRAFQYRITINLISCYLLQILIFIPLILAGAASIILIQMQTALTITSGIILLLAVVLFGAFIGIRMSLSLAFIIDKVLGPIEAIKLSIRATRSNCWRLIGLLLVQCCILILGIATLLIGFIWLLPLMYILLGVTYKKLQRNI